jgi:hypothetical protein
MLRRSILDSKSQTTLLHFYPYVLYFGMELMLKNVDLVVGTNADAAGSVIGWYVFKILVFAFVSVLFSGILYPIILKLEQTGNKKVPYMLFTTLNYPFEYAFFSLSILALQAENLPVIIRTPGFSYLVVILSSLFANYLRKTTAIPYKDLRQRIYQETFVRSISVFILVFIIIMISLLLKRFV